MSDEDVSAFVAYAAERGVKVQVFGMSTDNARAFWNWQFIEEKQELPQTRKMLMRACDTRLPARLTLEECDAVASVLIEAAALAMGDEQKAYGT
jgi:site-specific recombinase XerD